MSKHAWPSPTETTVLRILQKSPGGAYGLDVIKGSDGAIKRGSVYVLLGRLEEKGFVRVLPKKREPGYPGPPRPRYQLTADGYRVVDAAEDIGIAFAGA